MLQRLRSRLFDRGEVVSGLALAAAALNLLLGFWLALSRPARAADLQVILDWGRTWLAGGDLYRAADTVTDYPPNAIALLSPLTVVPWRWLVPGWSLVSIGAATMATYLALGGQSIGTRRGRLLVGALFLCWGGNRTLLQFSKVTAALSFGSLTLAASAPGVAGTLLGLALIKPHVAGPFLLAVAFRRRPRIWLTAAAVVLAAATIYCVRVPVAHLDAWAGFVRAFENLYLAGDGLAGRTSLRAWIVGLVPPSVVNRAWAVVSCALLGVACRVALWERRRVDRVSIALPLFCLWSLLSVFHLGNNLVLLLPAFAVLALVDDPPSRRPRLALAFTIQVSMMLDVPVHVAPRLASHPLLALAARESDRALALLAFVCLTWMAIRREREADASKRTLDDQGLSASGEDGCRGCRA